MQYNLFKIARSQTLENSVAKLDQWRLRNYSCIISTTNLTGTITRLEQATVEIRRFRLDAHCTFDSWALSSVKYTNAGV